MVSFLCFHGTIKKRITLRESWAPVPSCWEQWGQTAQQRRSAKCFLPSFQFPGWENNVSKSLFYLFNWKKNSDSKSKWLCLCAILKWDSENYQMVAVDYSSIHPSIHREFYITHGLTQIQMWTSAVVRTTRWSEHEDKGGEKGIEALKLHVECGEHGCWCHMVKRPTVTWFVYLISVSGTKGRGKKKKTLDAML